MKYATIYLPQKEGGLLETDMALFDIEIYCNYCGSEEVEVSYDPDGKCLVFECECGCKDTLQVESI